MKPVLDVTFGDSWARELRASLEKGRWQPVQKFFEATRNWEQREFYAAACAEWKGRPDWLDAWCSAVPGSSVPLLVRGVHSVRWAWEARGSRTADKVQTDAWPDYFSRLQKARQDLERAAALDAQDPTPWTWLITTAIGLQEDEAERRRRFEEARRRDPANLSAHARMLTGLTAKWSGSHEAMFAFARDAAAQAPEGSPLHGLIPRAHVERWLAFGMDGDERSFKTYLRGADAVAEVENAWQRSVGSKQWRPFQGGLAERNLYAFCFWYQRQPQKARRELQATRGFATETPWGYAGDPLAVFAEAVQETGDSPCLDAALAAKVREYCTAAIQDASQSHQLALDYGEAGIAALETLLGKLAEQLPALAPDRRAKATKGAALIYGSYLGETLRRRLGGAWENKLPNGEEALAVRTGTAYRLPLGTVYQRITQPASGSVLDVYRKWVEEELRPYSGAKPPPIPKRSAPEKPAGGVADDMRGFAAQAVVDARTTMKIELDYGNASLAQLDAMADLIRRHAPADPTERNALLNMAALKLGAYLGEVLRIGLGGAWITGGPHLPPGMPVLALVRDDALPVPAMREFLDGRAVDMAGSIVSKPTEYAAAVADRQAAWLDQVVRGAAATRDDVKRAMSDDLPLSEQLLGYAESALLTAAARFGLRLDFSEASLEGVEQALAQLHDATKLEGAQPTPEALRTTAIVWGTYVGEVMRRSLGGRWLNTPVPDQGKVLRLVIGEAEVYPLRKVEKRIVEGPGEAIPFYFRGVRAVVEGKLK